MKVWLPTLPEEASMLLDEWIERNDPCHMGKPFLAYTRMHGGHSEVDTWTIVLHDGGYLEWCDDRWVHVVCVDNTGAGRSDWTAVWVGSVYRRV